MKQLLSVVLLLLIVFNDVFSQNKVDSILIKNNNIERIEDFILIKLEDSATFLLSKHKITPYISTLRRIARNDNPGYKDYLRLIERMENRPEILYQDISNFINSSVQEPQSETDINLDYVRLKWKQVSKLRDDVSIEEASKVQLQLDSYINKFEDGLPDVKRAKILSSTHEIVVYNIQNEVDKGKKLCLQNFDLAKELNDKELMIISLYYLCDFLILEGKLDEYISVCENSLAIENSLLDKSSYYVPTLIHIVDAYVYKGGNDKRVINLLTELYNYPKARQHSFSLYAKYLGTINLNSAIAQQIFKQFEVPNLIEFSKKTEKLGEVSLNPNDLYQLQRELSNTLEVHGYLKEAIALKDKSVVLTKKIYSQDLANSLASYKTSQAVKQKDLEIKYQKERTDLYIIIASLVAIMLFVSVFAWLRSIRQSKVLEVKNKQINKTLKEKEWLIREVHHRVKNNFQIVSSLLELQTKGIEDEKALILANEGKNRVKSMALIHQKLYQNEDGLIDFNDYTHLLVKELTALYASNSEVETSIEAENMRFDVDTAIPLGLIINELITNAYKYALKENKKGKLNVSINRIDSENYKLAISDNGPGLNSDFDIKKAKSLGLRLVNRLVKQIQGSLLQTNLNGAKFEIVFKDIHARRKIM